MGRWASDACEGDLLPGPVCSRTLPFCYHFSCFNFYRHLPTLCWNNQCSPPIGQAHNAGPLPDDSHPAGNGTLGTVLRSVGFVQGNKAGFCGIELLTGGCEQPANYLKHTFSGRKAIWAETNPTFLKSNAVCVLGWREKVATLNKYSSWLLRNSILESVVIDLKFCPSELKGPKR